MDQDRTNGRAGADDDPRSFELLAESVGTLFWLADWNTHQLLYLNGAYERITGHPAEELFEKPSAWLARVDPAHRDLIVNDMLNEERQGRFDRTIRIFRPEGEARWVRLRGYPVCDDRGRVTHLAGTGDDITERKNALEGLRATRDAYRSLAENAGDLITRHALDGRILYASPSMEDLLGFEPGRTIGARLPEWLAPEEVEAMARRGLERLDSGQPELFEFPVRHRDGSRRILQSSCRLLFGEDGQPQEVVAVSRDVTKQQQAAQALVESEERFRQLAGNIDGIFWLVDWKSGRVIYQTPAIERLWGDDPVESADAPFVWVTRVHPEDRPLLQQGVERLRSEGRFEATYRIVRPDGELRWVRSRGFAIHDAHGEIERLAGLAEDVTDRRRLEERVQQTQKLESLGVLAGGIAHDFNNLLTGILGNASLVLEQLPADSGAYAMIQEIDHAARRAADLCSQMLSYSGRTTLVMRPLDLTGVVRDILPLLAAPLRGTVVEYDLDERLPPIRGDATQLGQIVLNLLTNALEALGDAPGSIRIRTGTGFVDAATLRESYLKEELPAGDYVHLEVADSGCGMDLDTQRKLFEPFFTTKFTGRGLGLAAMLGIVRGHGGALILDSAPGEGSTFRVLFPAREGARVTRPEGTPVRKRDATDATILVIDDEAVVRSVAERILRDGGYRVLCAADGQSGLDLHRDGNGSVGAVLLDLTMPGLSGEEVLRELRRRSGALPVVLMSGYTESEVGGPIRELGYGGFVRKPFASRALLDPVREALAAREGPRPGFPS
ncbi:MAG: PAS domain S-box protein [Myxococcales bacterium]|nr:PAS domain S-box protein [Myxococcales bacterium]